MSIECLNVPECKEMFKWIIKNTRAILKESPVTK